jgi:hypothetical protein
VEAEEVEEQGAEDAALIKSRNHHLTGGEKSIK